MDNQHRNIRGYRELNQEEIDLMNQIKEQGEQLQALIDKLRETDDLDQRWISLGNTNLQQGIMFLVRGVAQPTTF